MCWDVKYIYQYCRQDRLTAFGEDISIARCWCWGWQYLYLYLLQYCNDLFFIYCNANKAILSKSLNLLLQYLPSESTWDYIIPTTNYHSATRSIVVPWLVQFKSNSSNISLFNDQLDIWASHECVRSGWGFLEHLNSQFTYL